MDRRILSTALALLVGCATAPEDDAPPAGATGPTRVGADLSATNEDCDTVAPDRTLEGGGTVNTTRSYNHTGCASAYLLDLNRYSAANTAGTLVAYADEIPTTRAECEKLELRVYVWRRAQNGSSEYVGNTSEPGRWVADPWGEEYCEAPAVRVEDEIEGYAPGSNYRFGLRAQTLDAAGSVQRRELYFETMTLERPRLARDVIADLERVSDLFAAQPQGRVDPVAAELFGSGDGVFCRHMDVELSLYELVFPTLTDLGANAETITSYLEAERTAHEFMCEVEFPSASVVQHFQFELASATDRMLELVGQIGSALGISTADAADAVNGQLLGAISGLVQECGVDAGRVADFVHLGPEGGGPTLEAALFGGCSPQLGALRGRLGIAPRGDLTTRALEQCINDAVADLDRECNSPIASGGSAPAAQPSSTPADCSMAVKVDCPASSPAGQECWEYHDSGFPGCNHKTKVESVTREVKQIAERLEPHQALAEQIKKEQALEESGATVVTYGGGAAAWFAAKTGNAALAATILGVAETTAQGLNAIAWVSEKLLEREQEIVTRGKAEITEACKLAPRAPVCREYQQRCPGFDLSGGPAWYESSPDFAGGSRELTFYDRINHCMCEALGRNSVFCPQEDEREKHDCLTDPMGGPDDGPRPECVKYLKPDSVSRDAFDVEFCKKARPECEATVFVTEAGGCGCPSAPGEGNPEDLCRDVENVLRCQEDAMASVNLANCGCQPVTSGRTPFGGNPGCLLDPAAAPGSRDAWLSLEYDDLFIDRRFDVRPASGGETFRDVLMYEPGYTFAVTPGLYRKNFEAIGDRLNLEVYVPPESPASGYFGAVQAYCTRGSVQNQYLGQVEIDASAAGSLFAASFALDQNLRSRCFGADDEVRLTFALNTEPDAPRALGIAGFDFAGNLFPVDRPNPLCPDPAPEGPVSLVPTIRTWTFPDGTTRVISELLAGRD